MRSRSTNGSVASGRRAMVLFGSNRAHRRVAAKSKPAISEAELQVLVHLAPRFPERAGELILQRDAGERELDQVGVRLDAGQLLGLCHQHRAYSATDPATLLVQQSCPLRSLHDGFKFRL